MSITLFHTLVRTSLATTEPTSAAIQRLLSASDLEWKRTIVDLNLHRLLPLVWYSLLTHGLSDTVPQPYLAEMQDAYRQTLLYEYLLPADARLPPARHARA